MEKGCLKCYVHKFADKFDLSEIRCIYPCLKYRLLALHLKNKNVRFLKVDAKKVFSDTSLSGIDGFLWSASNIVHLDTENEEQTTLCTLTQDGHISIHSVYQTTVTVQLNQHISDISGFAERGLTTSKTEDVELVFYNHVTLVTRVKGRLLVNEIKKHTIKLLSVIDIPNGGSDIRCYDVINDYIVFFDFQSTKISLHQMYSGNVYLVVDLTRLNFEPDRILTWCLSADLKSLVVMENTLALTWIDLDSYVNKYSSCVQYSNPKDTIGLSNSAVLNTCHIGDSVWREKLFSLNNTYSKQIKPPWYKRLMSSKEEKGQSSKRKVSGFHGKNLDIPQKTTDVELKTYLPASLQNMKIQNVSLGKHSFSMVLYSEGETVFTCCDFSTKIPTIERFPLYSFVLLSDDPNFPHFVVMETHLLCLITELTLQQEEFVSKIMLYAGASLADALCHINKWGRCSIPLHALEVGLKHRQLDTVSFFLKSKENFFSSTSSSAVSSPSAPGMTSPTWSFSSSHLDNLGQLEPALNLLLQTIKENTTDSQSKNFAQKLADVTLNFLYGLMLDGLSLKENLKDKYGHENEVSDLKQALEKLLDIVSDLRSCINCLENAVVGPCQLGLMDRELKTDTVQKWEYLNTEQKIENGVKENKIPDMQSQLHQIGEGDQARLENIIQYSLKKVIKHLSDKESKPAINILSNLGYNIDDKLWEIALMTEDSQIQDFVLSVLKSRSSLQQHHQKIIDYASSVKDGYPCASFTVASNVLADDERKKEELEYLPITSAAKFDLSSQCGDLMMLTSPALESSPGLYAEVLWDWLRFWDVETQQRVFLDSKLRKGDVTQIYKDVDSRLLLNYLLRHNKIKDLTHWINNLVENKDFVTLHMIVNNLNYSTDYVRDVVLDMCARNGIIKETVDFTDLLSNLRLVGGPFMASHPVLRFHTGDIDGFHSDFVQYCVINNLPSVLWHYCHYYQISSDLLQKLSYSVQDCKWIQMFVLFYCLTKNPHDSNVIYEASLANAGMTWSLEQPSVSKLIKIGETLTAMATLMYSPYDIHQVVPGVSKLQVIDDMSIEEVEKALLPYPKLHSALFPASTIDTPKNDVSVYDLLKDNAPFDPTRLFGWQTTNKLAGEDCQRHLPHFSSTDLVSKYGVVEKIKYTFYLKQGRPSFAYTSFLAEELDSDATTISSSRLLQATSTALWIGVRNFHVSQVSCACVVFTELLGQDSVLLRTHLQVGQEILIHLNQNVTGSGDKRKENIKRNEEKIINWLCGCLLNRKKYGGFVLQKLENAIIASVTQDRILETSFDAAQKWLIAVLFCRVLQLPMTTKFLEICAQADKWLPFLWFAQMHQYTKEQLQTILYHFKSQHLQQHLHYVIENAEAKALLKDKSEPQKAKSKAQDSRSALYSRIGVSNKEETTADVSSSEEEANTQLTQTLTQQTVDTESEEGMTIDIQSVPDDIFGVVFMAQKSKCPWKSLLHLSVLLCNPILAELAACFKDALIQPCICGWLISMMNSAERDKILKDHGKNISKWTIKHIGYVIDIYLNNNWGSTLATSFHIFQPLSPLLHFLRFSAEIKERKNYSQCKVLLEDFKESMHQFSHGDKDKRDQEDVVIGDSDWIQLTVYRILHHHFLHTSSLYDILQLLKLLDCESIVLVFSFDVPDFGKLSRMVQCMVDAGVTDVNFAAFVSADSSQYLSECEKVVNLMLEQGLFREARKFSREAGLSVDHVTIKEIYSEKSNLEKSSVWKSLVGRKKFWHYCCNEMKKHDVSSECIKTFFMGEVDKVDSDGERAFLYDLCITILDTDQLKDPKLINDMYHQLWVYKIKDRLCRLQTKEQDEISMGEDIFALDDQLPKKLQKNKKELICFGKMPKTSNRPKDLTDKEIQALGLLVEELLDQGEITESCHLAAEFLYYSQDLAIILTCVRLSLESITVSEMDPAMHHLLTPDPSNRFKRQTVGSVKSLQRSTSTASLASVSSLNLDFLPPDKEKVFVVLDTLYGYCNHGSQCCNQIINCYVIACVLDMKYEEVVISEEFDILQALLKTDFRQRFRLASEYLSSSSLTGAQVAGFLSDSIVQGYNVTFGKTDLNEVDSLLFNPSHGVEVIEDFVKLCHDPSLLGDRLVDAVASLSGDTREISKSVLATQTELLIAAHLCHTSACNMEGISNVLRAARILTACLECTEEFSLMVRLLIGVGRFNEMTYIFDSLKQNESFELLLKKGIEKENSLKIAILDYLKRFHPKDRDSYDMVAHYFMMHREIAETLEKRAHQALAVFKNKPIDNSPETQSALETIVQYFTDAAESYVKEKCIRHAQVCARQARLVSLQIQNLSAGLKVIHLSIEEAENLVATHPKFLEALVVSETYGRKGSWPGALCNNVIVNGDFRYLQDFKSHVKLTPNLISDAVDLYQMSQNKSSQSINNIKKFLTYCKDIRIQYKIAQDLELRDVMLSLEKGDAGSYIKDIISTMS